MRVLFTLSAFAFSLLGIAQVTLRISALPTNTPANANVYFAGSANNWNPGDVNYALQPNGTGQLEITIPEGTGTVEYKFTRGSWPTVEGNAGGSYLPNRSFTFTGAPQTLNLTVQSWEDLGGSGANSTAAANVQILNAAFFMPQLGVNRRIWLYLPPDYETSAKNYPVLYMQDGQNLFDNATSFSGEWQVDETLNNLFNAGDYGAIVVGIDNGGSARLDEYSPWVNSNYNQGGDGAAYMQFVAETLKPYIDANYRSRPEATYNALIGSSMGALISVYGACQYPELFEKAGLFSPAFWFAQGNLTNYISNQATGFGNMRAYFVCGQNESSSMVSDMNAIKNNLIANGVAASNTLTLVDPAGTHSESFWRAKFGAAYQWLFAETALSSSKVATTAEKIIALANGHIYADGLPFELSCDIIATNGQRMGTTTLRNGRNALPALTSGLYVVKPEGRRALKIVMP